MAATNLPKIMRFEGHKSFRHRLLLATLSGKVIRIDKIRSDDEENPGLRDFEASFLRLLEKITNGSSIEISYTGTSVLYRPGVIVGGKLFHDCPISRAIGYFLEPIIALAPFAKIPLALTLTGITNDNVDVSVDTLRTVTLMQLKTFGIEDGVELRISKRGAVPLGGGEVFFRCPVVRSLKTAQILDEGKIKRIRGIAYATRISPQMANRVANSARSVLTRYIPDVYVYTDVYKGLESGSSPGYACNLVAESDTGALLSAECAYQPRKAMIEKALQTALARGVKIKNKASEEAAADIDTMDVDDPAVRNRLDEAITSQQEIQDTLDEEYSFPTPEDLGIRVARMLLQEIRKGGCVDTTTQWLPLLFIALGPPDVGKIKLGGLSPVTVSWLRDLKTFFGITFKITPDNESKTVLLTGVGIGFENITKRAG